MHSLPEWKPASRPSAVSLRGRAVQLEPLNAARHAAALWQALQGHDELWRWMADGPFASAEPFHEALRRKQEATETVFFALLPAQTGLAAGYASLMRCDPANGVVEVGNILFSPPLQRTVAATEAMYLLMRYVFEDLGYRRLEWKCDAENAPSRRAALRLGFSFEGVFRQHMVIKARNRDTAWFSMLDGEWPRQKAAFEVWLDPGNFDAEGRQRKRLAELLL